MQVAIKSRDVHRAGTVSNIKTVWWVERANGWTPCYHHEHHDPDEAQECWDELVGQERAA